MMTMADLVTVAGFLGVTILVFMVGVGLLQLQRDRIRERLLGVGRQGTVAGLSASPGLVDAIELPAETSGRDSALDQELRRAGWYRTTAKQQFRTYRYFALMVVIVITGAIAIVLGPERRVLVARTVVVGVAAAGLAWGLPRLYLRAIGNRRVGRIQRGLPDSLDLMTMCLTGGLSLSDAFDHVSREIAFAHRDLALELLIVKCQSELRSSEFAFQQFSRRIDLPDVVALASLITQGLRLGTDVVTSIRDHADNLRLRGRQLADERSNKASVKMLFPLTLCLLPSVFIILWGPSLMELFKFLKSMQGKTGPL